MAKDCTTCVETQEKQEKLHKVIAEHKGTRGALIPVLHEAQEIYGYLPMEVQLEIANGLDVPLAEVYGVVSFYTRFSINPKGKYLVNVCMGTACYVKGAGLILEKLKEALDLDVDECSEDGKFSLEACRCIGACGLAPVMTINEDVYGRLVPEDVVGIIEKYKNL
ncbi:MAG: NAD(P)H-dependent oxidoreductase subunit E [Eubacteriales bacterium]|nr:NAD(P)H-dependent oxidoreductase subunit E [Eubacteriales bacterium]MDD4390379.1 NAD(P)H-dependent oxidoreductase subunit E [Eubacteriales bacterium]